MRHTYRHRSGKIAIQAALMLPVLLAFGALAIDRGILQVRDQEAQVAADAVAHAAANSLDGSEEGLEQARSAASTVAARNRVGLEPVALDGQEGPVASLELGRWAGGRFVPGTDDPVTVSAARARVTRTDIPTVFGYPAFGIRYMAVDGTAIAIAGGAGAIECPLPLAVPDCSVPDLPGLCDADLVLNADGDDTVGWALVGQQRPSASTVRAALDACGFGQVSTADTVTLNNGVLTGAMHTLARTVSDSALVWDVDELGELPAQSPRSGVTRYGHVLDGWFIVFHDASACQDTSYNETALPIEGFLRAYVYDVETSGAVEGREIHARLGCAVEADVVGGGGNYGTSAPPRFVEETVE